MFLHKVYRHIGLYVPQHINFAGLASTEIILAVPGAKFDNYV